MSGVSPCAQQKRYLSPVIGRMIDSVKKDITHRIAEFLTAAVGIADHCIQICKTIQYLSRMKMVAPVDFGVFCNRTKLPYTQGLLIPLNPAVPDLVSIQDMTEQLMYFYRQSGCFILKQQCQLVIAVLVVGEQVGEKAGHGCQL